MPTSSERTGPSMTRSRRQTRKRLSVLNLVKITPLNNHTASICTRPKTYGATQGIVLVSFFSKMISSACDNRIGPRETVLDSPSSTESVPWWRSCRSSGLFSDTYKLCMALAPQYKQSLDHLFAHRATSMDTPSLLLSRVRHNHFVV